MSTITHIATCSICGSSFISQRRVVSLGGSLIESYYLFCTTCGHKTRSVNQFAELDDLVKWVELPTKHA